MNLVIGAGKESWPAMSTQKFGLIFVTARAELSLFFRMLLLFSFSFSSSFFRLILSKRRTREGAMT